MTESGKEADAAKAGDIGGGDKISVGNLQNVKGAAFGRGSKVIIYEGDKPVTIGDMSTASQAQVESVLYDARHKFDPTLYVERAIEQELNAFFDAPLDRITSNCYLLVAPAGSGKTNLLCHLALERAVQQPTMLLLGGSLYLSGTAGLLGGIRSELEEDSDKVKFRSDGDSLHTLHRLGEEINRDALLLVDAINEYEHPAEMRKALQDILRKTRAKRIKLLVTCRDYYWGLFKGEFWKGATVNALPAEDEEAGEEETAFNLFSASEHEQALALYLDHYAIVGRPVGNAAEQCRHPLLLRFFCEAYRGQDIGRAEDIRLKELFDRYWEQKLVSIADRAVKQGDERLQTGLTREVSEYLLNIAAHMLHNNVRAIPLAAISQATRRDETYDDPRSLYGRIRDEFIILEEKEAGKGQRSLQVAFVYEEFMEYVMARALIAEWDRRGMDEAGILAEIEELTQKYEEFVQILGVMVYLALMLKEERNMAFWPLLLNKGKQWQKVVFEAFRKLPPEQLDSNVFDSLNQMLLTDDEDIQKQVLDLLKVKRVGAAASVAPALIDSVCDLTSKKMPVARRAVLALEHMQSDKVLPVILQALYFGGKAVRENAFTVLSRMDPIPIEEISKSLTDKNAQVREKAARALGDLGDQAVVEPLIKTLKDRKMDVRAAAAGALGNLGSEQAMEPLIEALKDREEYVQHEAALALGKLGDKRAVEPLIEVLTRSDVAAQDPNNYRFRIWDVRYAAANALGRLGDKRAVEPLIDALTGSDAEIWAMDPFFEERWIGYPDLRYAAAVALGRLGDLRAVEPLIDALKGSNRGVRSAAAWALGGLGDLRAVEPLIKALEIDFERISAGGSFSYGGWYRIWEVQYAAAGALAQLGDQRAVAPLIRTLTLSDPGVLDPDPHFEEYGHDFSYVRCQAAEALGELGDKRAVDPLIEALGDSHEDVRDAAAAALKKLGIDPANHHT